MNKETLSISPESPKHKLASEEKYKDETEKLPKPTGWRILVLPFKMKEKTKGGVIMANTSLERQQLAAQCANVLATG